jgi:tetratricopeptide (TPR) repeat protein
MAGIRSASLESGDIAVFDNKERARHLPFFTELASLDDGDAAWRSVSAGLVVLRLVDAWIEEGAAAVSADGWGVRSVEAAIEEMPQGQPARAVLASVVEVLRTSSTGDMHAIAPRLMAYARALNYDAKWALAADVYQTVISHVHPVEESDTAIAAHLWLAHCQRNMGWLDEAAVSYAAASSIATDVDDMFGILRAQIGAAKIATARGNMPSAEQLLDDTIARASRHEHLVDVHALALQDRANLAFHRARYDLAIELAYASLELTTDPINRDRLLSSVASSFYMLGVHSAAKDAWLILEATAQDQYNRWYASINLMEMAAREGSMPIFERYRRSLVTMSLPPELEAQFYLQTAESYEALSQFEQATSAAARARLVAERYGFNRVAFEADAVVERARSGKPSTPLAPEAPVPAALEDIAAQISALRRAVPT